MKKRSKWPIPSKPGAKAAPGATETKIGSVTVKCEHCGTTFPSPIHFGTLEALETSYTSGNRVQCPNAACRRMIDCNRHNMSYVLADRSAGGVYHGYGETD